jgi:DNA topoisomerase IA
VELLKEATDKLKISAGEVMEIAESLYAGGFISYPKTHAN